MFENVRIHLTVSLTIKAPFLSQSSTAGKIGLDASQLRNHNNKICIPGSLVKGCLWESMFEIHDFLDFPLDTIIGWFGDESKQNSFNRPNRGKLIFSDFILENDLKLKESSDPLNDNESLNYRIKINNQRGAVEKNALMIFEMPFKSGQDLTFKGELMLHDKESNIEKIKNSLLKAFRWIPALGSQRGIGFGKIIKVQIDSTYKKFEIPSPEKINKTAQRYMFSFKPQSPFCVSQHMPVNNIFESEEIISGATIKGTIAGTLNRLLDRDIEEPLDMNTLPEEWKMFGKYFHQLHFSHAFPALNTIQRPQQIPLSIIASDDCNIFLDATTIDGIALIYEMSPKFQADWKDSHFSSAKEIFYWPDLSGKKELRVRTAMDYTKRRSEDELLFSMQCIVPDNIEWLGWWDTGKIDPKHRDNINFQLQELFDLGLTGFSKTKSNVKVDYEEQDEIADISTFIKEQDSKQWVFTLQTPALMFNPSEIAGPENCTGLNLKAAYKKYFMEVSDQSIVVNDFYASQSFRGRYLFYHFSSDTPYNPFLLTDAGSVFIIEPVETKREQAIQWLKKVIRFGLPVPEWAKTGKNSDLYWKSNPFQPENGFGEIILNTNFEKRLNEAGKGV